jgi:imidazolonepropionase-like amidohydrolase
MQQSSMLVIRGATIFDGTGRAPFASRHLVISSGQVAEVDAATAPAGASLLDATGLALLPGLIDFHVHLWAPDGADLNRTQAELIAEMTGGRPSARRALVAAGVTTVRSVGDPVGGPADVLDLRRQVAEEGAPGPRLYCTGPLITGPDGHPAFLGNPMAMEMMTRRVADEEEARARVAELAALGVDGIKLLYDDGGGLLALMQVDAMQAAVEAAHAHGLWVAVHVGDQEGARMAVEAGADTLEHSPGRGRLDDATLALMRERGVVLVPTLGVREGGGMATSREAEAWAEEARRRRASDEDPLAAAIANTAAAHRAGVIIAAGTDTQGPGMAFGRSLHRELTLLVASGLTPAEALRAATAVPGAWLAAETGLGTVTAGAPADLILVEGQPWERIEDVGRVRTVIQRGVVTVPAASGPTP